MPSLRSGSRRSVAMETPRQSPPRLRTAEVLYLLSRGAHLEHPHMINVHYAAYQPGPTLRDVKARLIALRGKGMPDSFSWSYKRNYKDTFIWCDLFDDDFILPLGGSGEYVLKAMELFDASQDDDLHPLLIRSPRVSSPSKYSRPFSTQEHLHVESDVSMAIKKSLLLIGGAGSITSDSSMDLNKQIMNNLSHSKRPPDVCSLDHSEVSSSCTYPSFEGVPESKKYPERQSPKTTGTKQCNAGSQTAHREPSLQRMDRKEMAVGGTTTTNKKDEMAACSPSPARTPRVLSAKRRGWEKEIDKTTICSELIYPDEQPSPVLEGSGSSAPEDPFLYGVLRMATRLGSSFRPRLCRGIDVLDSTETKTKLPHRIQTKEEVHEVPLKSSVKQENPNFIDEPVKNTNSLTQAPDKPVKEFRTLSEYFESKERNSPVNKLYREPQPQAETRPPGIAALATKPQEFDTPRPDSRPFGNDALDASYRKTMEVLAKLPTSRGGCRIHTIPQGAMETPVAVAQQGEVQKNIRSESKENKLEVECDRKVSPKANAISSRQSLQLSDESDGLLHSPCSIHRMNGPAVVQTSEDFPTNMTPRQRRPNAKKLPGGTNASPEASITRDETTMKTSVEKTMITPRDVSRESTSKLVNAEEVNTEEDTKFQLPGSFTFDSRSFNSGNEQAYMMATQVVSTKTEAAAEATPKLNLNEDAKGWPFEQPVRPRDFKSREDRPLIPGLTHMDWEKSFQEAVIHSEPPMDMVLHECSQCGRTFKLESLQVHQRGCHGVNKPKTSPTQRRVSL